MSSNPLWIPLKNLKKQIAWYEENSPEEGKKYLVVTPEGVLQFVTIPVEGENA